MTSGARTCSGSSKHLRTVRNNWGKRFSDRAVYNNFMNLLTFLNEYGKGGLVESEDWPKYEEPKVVVYNDASLTKLLAAAEQNERDLIVFFLGSGAREGEVAHAEYVDILWESSEFHIHSKVEEYDWKVKDSEQRLVPLSDIVMQMLRNRRQRHSQDILLFPNSFGRPAQHLLRIVKGLAFRAGLNCGHCTSTLKKRLVTCATHPVCQRFRLHKFRKTWATKRSRAGMDIVTLAARLGHSDLDTTRAYVAADDNSSERLRAQVNEADSVLKSIPPAI